MDFKKIDTLDNIKHYCICGIPFSAISEAELIKFICYCCESKEKAIINTPNLNFLRTARKDYNFKKALINSDILIPDGMPIIWLAWLLDIPIKKRLAGSSIIIKLISESSHFPFKVFFFGGEEGIAKKAHRITNSISNHAKSVGYIYPGFGDFNQLSKTEYLQEINASKADILLVSLPSIKGINWINKNNNKINVPLKISSGITVNFIAKSIKRAPELLQKIGLEWAWRMLHEPRLISRYILDGIWLLYVVLTRIIPLKIFHLLNNKTLNHDQFSDIEIKNDSDTIELKLSKLCDEKTYEKIIDNINKSKKLVKIIIDAKNVAVIDSRFTGELILLKSRYNNNFKIINPSLNFKIYLWLYFANKELL